MQIELKKNYGYYIYEEYGVRIDRLIIREEYDDGASLIDGKPTDTSDATLRVRSCTPFNFVICVNSHVLNNLGKIDFNLTRLLDEILLGTKTLDDLVNFVVKLPRTFPYAG